MDYPVRRCPLATRVKDGVENPPQAGTEVVVDGSAAAPGFLIVDPSFVEQRLKLRFGRSLAPHKLASYARAVPVYASTGSSG